MLKISYGSVNDAANCCLIANSCSIFSSGNSDKNGFLSFFESKEAYIEYFSEGFSLVATLNNSIVGFLIGYFNGTPSFQKLIPRETIAKMGCEEKFSTERIFYIKTIAVSTAYRNQKVASRLYEKLFDDYKSHAYCGMIVEKPIRNRASILFHKKLGFTKIATVAISELRMPNLHPMPNLYPMFEHGSVGVYFKGNK